MAILITVINCDECGKVTGLKTDEDWSKFENDWWEGFKYQFCPVCCEKPETQTRRLSDSQMMAEMVEPIREISYANNY